MVNHTPGVQFLRTSNVCSLFSCKQVDLPKACCIDRTQLPFRTLVNDWITLVHIGGDHGILIYIKQISKILVLVLCQMVLVCGIYQDFRVSILFEQ